MLPTEWKGDFASTPKQKNQYSQGLKWDLAGEVTLKSAEVVEQIKKKENQL